MVNILISGWYGFANLGDEAILSAIARNISKEVPCANIEALSYNPAFTKGFQGINASPHLPSGLRSWLNSLITGKIYQSLSAFLRCDILLLGGGGFLSDWQPEAPWVWLRQVLLARLFGKRIMLYGIGAGPFTRTFGKFITRSIINNCVGAVTVRDEKSKQWLLIAGVNEHLIEVTADPAVRYQLPGSIIMARKPVTIGLCIAPIFHLEKYWPGKKVKCQSYVSAMTEVVNGLIEGGFKVVFILMQESSDRAFANEILKSVPHDVEVLQPPTIIDAAVTQLARADILVTMRFHAAILGALQGIPVAAIVYHHKVAEFIDSIGMKEFAEELGDGSNWREADIDPDRMLRNIEKISANYDAVRQKMLDNFSILREQEKGNVIALKKLLEKVK